MKKLFSKDFLIANIGYVFISTKNLMLIIVKVMNYLSL